MNTKHKTAKYYLIPAFICLLGIVGIVYYYFFAPFSKLSDTVYLYIDNNDDIDSVVAKLEPVAANCQLTGFRTLARHYDYAENIKTGRYAIDPHTSTLTVFRHLKTHQQDPIMVTVPEARTIEQLAGRLSRKMMLDSIDIEQALKDADFCKKQGFTPHTIICLFVPNTYELYWDTTMKALTERMRKEYDAFWNEDRKAKAQQAGLTPTQVSTLASIIDEETANSSEKPMIAGMYLNRLKTGMPLQADPTIKFALKDFSLKRIYHHHLTVDSPYNTYQNTGLPPGPIKVASIKGIDAVLNYAHHNYYYMCANSDFSGTHVFATSYKDHLQNAARYSKALNERGIK